MCREFHGVDGGICHLRDNLKRDAGPRYAHLDASTIYGSASESRLRDNPMARYGGQVAREQPGAKKDENTTFLREKKTSLSHEPLISGDTTNPKCVDEF
jgi:hypothetical protein